MPRPGCNRRSGGTGALSFPLVSHPRRSNYFHRLTFTTNPFRGTYHHTVQAPPADDDGDIREKGLRRDLSEAVDSV